MEPGNTNLSLRDLPQIDTASSCRYCKRFVASTTDLLLLPPSGRSQIAPRKRADEDDDRITVGRLLSLQSTDGILWRRSITSDSKVIAPESSRNKYIVQGVVRP